MRNYITLCFLLFVTFQATAQNLTLKEAIDLGIKNSKQLQISKSRIELANATLIDAKNNRLPNVDISGAYLRILQPTINLKTGSGGGGAAPNVNQAIYGMANVSYPIYAGGRIKYGIESAKYLLEATTMDASRDTQQIVLNVINVYTSLYKAQLSVQIVNAQLLASRQRDTTFSHLEQNGLLARNDLLKTELQTSNIELQLLAAENDVRITSYNLELLLGLPVNSTITVDTSFITTPSIQGFDDYLSTALHSRKDLLSYEQKKKAAELNIKMANASAYPTLGLSGGYIAADIPNFLTITNAVNFGVGVKYNLASLWKKNSKLLEARAQQKQLLAGQSALTEQISMDVNTNYQNYLLSVKKIEVYKKALTQAAENYRITKNKYDNGLATITELLDADAANRQAQLDERLSEADAVTAYYRLQQTAGIIKP